MPDQSNPTSHQVSKRLNGKIQAPSTLTIDQHDQMYALLTTYFANVTRAHFEHDLAEKDWVVVLNDAATGKVRGFSTLMLLRIVVDEQPIVAFFSGDTIIHRDYWGETELPRLWSAHVFGYAKSIHDAKVYWFLISSGYKTYRFFSVFFEEFHPSFRAQTPPHVQKIIDTLAAAKFGDEYDPETGIVRFDQAVPLREGVAEVTPKRLKDPHIAFFVQRNPGYADGDQLACLVEISPDNVTPAGRRMLCLG